MIPLKAPSYRQEKICRQAKEEISSILRREVSDPRLRNLTVTKVDWNKRADLMKIGVCRLPENLLENQEDPSKEVLPALKSARSFLFERLRKRLAIRRFPSLRFEYDDSLDKAAEVWKTMGHWTTEPSQESLQKIPETVQERSEEPLEKTEQ